MKIEFYQQDFVPGFAAFLDDGRGFKKKGAKAFCIVNIGDFLATVETGDVPAADLPYFVAESMMHEIVHVLEKWFKVELSEEKVEALLTKYREKYREPDISIADS
jgi:hypothetical protein